MSFYSLLGLSAQTFVGILPPCRHLACSSKGRSKAMPGHWKVEDFKQEINTLLLLLQARPNLLQKVDTWTGQLKGKLQSMGDIPSAEMLQLYDAIKTSNLPDTVKTSLEEVLDQKAVGAAGPVAVVNKTQSCDGLHRYLTETELAMLEKTDMWASCPVLVRRLRLLGIQHLKESTKKAATAILVYFEYKRTSKLVSADCTYVLAEHIRSAFESCCEEVPVGVQRLASLPRDPQDLSQAHLQASYGNEMPAGREIPELAQIYKNNAWVRGNSKLVKQTKVFWLSSSPFFCRPQRLVFRVYGKRFSKLASVCLCCVFKNELK